MGLARPLRDGERSEALLLLLMLFAGAFKLARDEDVWMGEIGNSSELPATTDDCGSLYSRVFVLTLIGVSEALTPPTASVLL